MYRILRTRGIQAYYTPPANMLRAITYMSFFIGTNRTLYTNRIGDSFYIDEFSHQNFIKNYGMKYFHVNCEGEYLEVRKLNLFLVP